MNPATIVIVGLIASVTSAAIDDFTTGNNAFTADIYQTSAKNNDKNILFSPISAEIILALVKAGAKGGTATELGQSLHLVGPKEANELAIRNALSDLKGDENFSLHSANKIYVQNDFQINEPFKKIASEVYDASLENLDFSQSQEAVNTINQWVEKQTQNKIRNLVTSVDSGTVLILVNALHFKGQWAKTFRNESTKKENFYKTPEDAIQVDTMHNFNKRYGYYQSSELDAQFLEMDFKSGADQSISMVIVLPNKKDGLPALEAQIDKVFAPHQFSIEHVNLALPKFKIEDKIDFKSVLKSLGVTKAFDPEEADFSDIAGKKGDLVVSKALQKTFIDVDENGAEAAAATFVEFVFFSAPSLPPVVKDFVVDHPFLFYIKIHDLILFAGRVVDPSA